MLTKGIQVQKYIRASAGRAGMTVVFENINQPRHDGWTIYLPKITDTTTERQLQHLMASVDHEVGHERYSSFQVLKDSKVDPDSLLHFVWNFLEDSRVNNIEAREYRGFRENWDDTAGELIEKILHKAVSSTEILPELMTALVIWESQISKEMFPNIEFVTSKHTANKDILNVLDSYSGRLVACHNILDKEKGTKATYQLAYDILVSLGKDDSKSIKKAFAKKGRDGSSSTVDESTKTKSSKNKEDNEFKVVTIKLTKKDLQNFSLSFPEDGKEMGKTGINFEPVAIDSKARWDLTDYSKFLVVHYPKNEGLVKYFKYSTSASKAKFESYYRKCVGELLIAQENFAQQVRKIIQIRARVRTVYGQKKGKLDQSRLSRICFNAPGFNERIFKTRIENTTLDAAISILVDMSGSMTGEKAYYALGSVLLLNKVCSIINVPLEIIGFTDGYSSGDEVVPVVYVYKSFSDLRVSNENIIEYFCKSSAFMEGNPDGENILWAHDRLVKRKEKKKLLIVMSDGEPAASKSSNGLEAFTLKVIREIENSKQVDIYGLGLLSYSVLKYYRAHSVVTEVSQIPSKLLELIERKILT